MPHDMSHWSVLSVAWYKIKFWNAQLWYTMKYHTCHLYIPGTHTPLKACVYNEKIQVTRGIFNNWRPSRKKGVYRILADFHFLQDRANFWQTDLFWHDKHRSVILFRSICASFSRNNVCKKTQLSSGDLLFNEKQGRNKFETRSADFFFSFFLSVSLLISKTKTFI